MTPYEYEVMQNKEAFGKEMLETVTKLPQDLTFSPEFNDFITQLLVLDREYRPKTRDICSHPWLEGSFDSLIASKHNLKHRSKHRPSINEALNQTSFDAAAASASARSNNLGLVRLDSTDASFADNGHIAADDSSSNSIGQKRPLTVPLPRLSKEKSPLSNLEVEDCNVTISRSPSKNKGESPRGTSSILLCKKTLGSPSSSGVHGDEYGSSSADNTDGPADPVVRANMILPPIGDKLTSRNQDGMSYSMQDEDEQVDADSCAYNPQSLMNAAISSLSKGGSRRMDLCHSPPLTQSSPLDPECSSGGNSCNSAGSGVSFFGYGNRQYSAPRGSFANELSAPRGSFANDFSAPRGSFANDFSAPRGSFANDFSAPRGSFANDFSAPRGSFANDFSAPRGSFTNDFSAPRGSFANDAYTNPRGSFMSDCGTGPRSSFFNENSRASNNHMTRSMSSSVTASPTEATPLATPSTSNTPTLRNIDEESDETNIDELRNFLSGSGFSFLGTK
jgi:Mucin-like